MTAKNLVLAILITAVLYSPLYILSEELGAPPRRTGGDFPGEDTCANSECHGGTANSGNGSVSVMINGSPLNEYRYTPGETVPVAVTVADPDRVRWGFQITARTNDGCSPAGSFSALDGSVLIQEDTGMPGGCPEATIQSPTHSFPRGTPGSGTFDLNWTAPASDIGSIIFAAAGNAANGNRMNTGDNIYTTQSTVTPIEGGGGPAPSIDSGGAILSTGTPVVPQGSPASIITVFGQEFAPEGTAALDPVLVGEGAEARVSTELANTCLEVNNERASMFAVVPTQVNAQVPGVDLVGLGESTVVIVRGCGTANEQRSEAESIILNAASPAFFNFLNNAEGTNPIAAVHLDGVLVGESDLIPGGNFRPGEPDEFLSFFGTGFGPTDPPVEAGAIPQDVLPEQLGQARVTGAATMTIGGIPVPPGDLFYVGAAPCCAGLYQVVAKVPSNAPDGDLAVVLTIDGVASPEGPFITVRAP